jgi:hypothetical protein
VYLHADSGLKEKALGKTAPCEHTQVGIARPARSFVFLEVQ